MFRRLFNALTLLSALLLLGMLALWVRSARHTDEITLRTAPSYVGWPPVKWFVVRTRDALVLSARTEVAPYVLSGLPPWREDVVPGAVVAMGDWSDAAVPKPVLPPNGSNGRAATAREHADYAARVAPGYATCPLLTW